MRLPLGAALLLLLWATTCLATTPGSDETSGKAASAARYDYGSRHNHHSFMDILMANPSGTNCPPAAAPGPGCTAGGGQCEPDSTAGDASCCGGQCIKTLPLFMSRCCLGPTQVCSVNQGGVNGNDCCAGLTCGAIDQTNLPGFASWSTTCCAPDDEPCPDPQGRGCCGYACGVDKKCCRLFGVACDNDNQCCDPDLNQCFQGNSFESGPQCCRKNGQACPKASGPVITPGLGCCGLGCTDSNGNGNCCSKLNKWCAFTGNAADQSDCCPGLKCKSSGLGGGFCGT